MLVGLVLAATLFDPLTGAKTVERGVLSAPLTGELSSAARTWALAHRGELGLPPGSTLVNAESFGTRFGASFHLQQQLGGIDVYGANMVVTIDKTARVTLVTSGLVSYREARDTWLIDEREALNRAVAQVVLPSLREDGTPFGGGKRVFFQVGDDVHAGWLIHVPTLDLTRNLYFGIDATTGETLWRQNRIFYAELDANAYNPTPGGADAGVGVTPTVKVSLTHHDGGSMLQADAGGLLIGTQLDSYNCCVLRDCDPNAADAGPRRSMGSTMLPNPIAPGTTLNVLYDVVACDFQHHATNDVAKHDAGSFEYPPFDPPVTGPFNLFDPAGSDEFSEVHAFYQVNREYDWVRDLSRAAVPLFPGHQPAIVPFKMRDERKAVPRKPAIWSNVVFPDFQTLLANPVCVFMGTRCVINSFARIDNAAFLAVENFAMIPLPEYRNDVDTLMIFQGEKADFGYDSPVLWHEFGHGIVTATAGLGLDRLSIDNRSANNESGALHEGFADYFAGAFGGDPYMGRYVGPRVGGAGGMTGIRTEQFLRSLDNALSCPTVLKGEVHDDSQHVSAALYQARQTAFIGSDDGGTYDATFYAMLASLTMSADFAQVATVMTAHVNTAFPDAGSVMTDIFNQRGVINCSKVVDVTGGPPRDRYGIGTKASGGLTAGLVPGPYQLQLKVPNGLQSLTVTASVGGDPFGLGGGAPQLKVLVKQGATPITFLRQSSMLVSDAEKTVDMPVAQNSAQAVIDLQVPCGAGSQVFVTIGNSGTGATTLGNLTLTPTVPSSCTPDAGSDAGTMTIIIPGITRDGGPEGVLEGPMRGCGCSAGGAPLLLLALAFFRRGRQRVPSPLAGRGTG